MIFGRDPLAELMNAVFFSLLEVDFGLDVYPDMGSLLLDLITAY
jgi:hypothetical protein